MRGHVPPEFIKQASWVILATTVVAAAAATASLIAGVQWDFAPPAAPPITSGGSTAGRELPSAASPLPYSMGEPTNEEQAYLELINRARANPAAEDVLLATTTDADVVRAYQTYGVNLALMQAQMSAIVPCPRFDEPAAGKRSPRTLAGHACKRVPKPHRQQWQHQRQPHHREWLHRGRSYTYGENVFAYSYSIFCRHAGLGWHGGIGRDAGSSRPGAALVEVYNHDPTATAQLQNISTRAVVGTDDNGGIVVSGMGQQKVAVRAIGPLLTQYGIAGALQRRDRRCYKRRLGERCERC